MNWWYVAGAALLWTALSCAYTWYSITHDRIDVTFPLWKRILMLPSWLIALVWLVWGLWRRKIL
jgi:hypothetical protein